MDFFFFCLGRGKGESEPPGGGGGGGSVSCIEIPGGGGFPGGGWGRGAGRMSREFFGGVGAIFFSGPKCPPRGPMKINISGGTLSGTNRSVPGTNGTRPLNRPRPSLGQTGRFLFNYTVESPFCPICPWTGGARHWDDCSARRVGKLFMCFRLLVFIFAPLVFVLTDMYALCNAWYVVCVQEHCSRHMEEL